MKVGGAVGAAEGDRVAPALGEPVGIPGVTLGVGGDEAEAVEVCVERRGGERVGRAVPVPAPAASGEGVPLGTFGVAVEVMLGEEEGVSPPPGW